MLTLVTSCQKFWDGLYVRSDRNYAFYAVIRLTALLTLRDITNRYTVSRRNQISNDSMMIKNVMCKYNCLMPNVPAARLFNIMLK